MLKIITPLVLLMSCGAWAQSNTGNGFFQWGRGFPINLRPKTNIPAPPQEPQNTASQQQQKKEQTDNQRRINLNDESLKQPDERDTVDMIPFDPEDLKNPEDWKRKYFEIIIVINKSVRGAKKQTLDLYQNGKLAYSIPISTGRERYEQASGDPNDKKTPSNSYFTSTPTGYFTPWRLNIDHVSGEWKDAFMPYAVFFNKGIAIHEAPGGTEGKLGQRASGGCIRVHPRYAADIFWRVRNTGGPYEPSEIANKTFGPQAWYYQPYYNTAYSKNPQIPMVSKRGVPNLESFKSAPRTFRTLVIVEDREFADVAPLPAPNPERLRMILEERLNAGETVSSSDWQRLQDAESPKNGGRQTAPATGTTPVQAPSELKPKFKSKVVVRPQDENVAQNPKPTTQPSSSTGESLF